MVYLDNASSSFPVHKSICDEMDRINRLLPAAAGYNYHYARLTMQLIEDARQKAAQLMHINNVNRVIFTASATDAANRILGGMDWHSGDVVFVSPYEHNCVLRPLNRLKDMYGIRICELPLHDSLELNLDRLKALFCENKPRLVCCTHVSSVTGYILPIKDIINEAKNAGSRVLVDASLSVGLIDIETDDVDFLVFSGHKSIGGPVGAGCMILGRGVLPDAYISGDTMSDSSDLCMPKALPARYEPGCLNVSAVAGLGRAIDFIFQEDIKKLYTRNKALTDLLVKELSSIERVRVYIPENREKHLSIVSFNIEGLTCDECAYLLDRHYDIAVKSGLHGAALTHKYLSDEDFNGTVRAGIGLFTTQKDIEELVCAVRNIAASL